MSGKNKAHSSTCRWTRPLLLVGGLVVIITSITATWLLQEVEYLRIGSPSSTHTAVVTYRRYEAFKFTAPGQSGDKAGFIRIESSSGENYGKIPVPMIWMSRELEWTKDGARLPVVGEWSFPKREYRYWNESQTEEIVKQAR
jgi:hypothetical protein